MKEELNENIPLEKIALSMDETFHLYEGAPLYNKKFDFVMSFHPPGVAAVIDNTGAYHIDTRGNPIYVKRFFKTFGYYEDLAAVMDKFGMYHINIRGEPSYNKKFNWVGNFQEERCPVRDKTGSYFHIKKDGTPAYNSKYNYVGDFKYGISVVYDNDGYASHIDKNGKFIHDHKYRELGMFHKTFAIARDNKGAFHINKKGTPIYEERYNWVEPFYNGFAFACKQNGEKLIINEKGEQIQKIYDENINYIKEDSRQKLKGMMVGHWKSQIIYSIVKLNVFDKIRMGYNTFQSLQDELNIPEPSLDMIIKVLKIWDFIQEEKGHYALKYLGYLLTEDYSERLRYAALMWGEEHYIVMSKLLDALKSYESQFEKIYNQDIFSYINKNQNKSLIYNEAMNDYSIDYNDLIPKYDFSSIETILDVGGGSGKLLIEILQKNKNIKKGILFDLPMVINNAKDAFKESILKNKIEFLSGNFFETIPIKTDTIIMSRIIHDWNNDKVSTILKNVANCLNKNGKLILFETIVPENPKFDIGITLNFNLLTCVGGKERTLKEFEILLKKVGLEIYKIITGNSIISMIIAKKTN